MSTGTSAAALVGNARALSNLSQRQVALMAGISASTVNRIESSDLDPTFTVLERILRVCGYSVRTGVAAVADETALRAGRALLDPGAGIVPDSAAGEWIKRWAAIGLVGGDGRVRDADSLAFRAANVSRLAFREGSRRFEIPTGGWKAVARSFRDNGVDWALTGGYAASAYTNIANAVWPVFYVDSVEQAAKVAGLRTKTGAGIAVTLIPFDDVTRRGVVETAGGVRLAALWQIILDCYGGTGRMPEQASELVSKVTTA